MNLEDPYEKGFFPEQILEGLIFYYTLLDKVNLQAYSKPHLPFTRKDIEIGIRFLTTIQKTDSVSRLCHSHPMLTMAMDSIEVYKSCQVEELKSSELWIVNSLFQLQFTSTLTMIMKAKEDILKSLQGLTEDEKIKYLIENKYYYLQNSTALPEIFVKQCTEFCESLIAKFKELKSIEKPNAISEEVKKMVESYLSLIKDNIEENDLISPLVKGNFDLFTDKLKRMLLIPSYFDVRKNDKERTFHVYLLGVLQGRIEGYTISSNKESGLGRYDIALIPIEHNNPGVIIEIKIIDEDFKIDSSLTVALDQIEKNLYHSEMRNLGVNSIANIAIVFEGLNPHLKYKVSKSLRVFN